MGDLGYFLRSRYNGTDLFLSHDWLVDQIQDRHLRGILLFDS